MTGTLSIVFDKPHSYMKMLNSNYYQAPLFSKLLSTPKTMDIASLKSMLSAGESTFKGGGHDTVRSAMSLESGKKGGTPRNRGWSKSPMKTVESIDKKVTGTYANRIVPIAR